MIKLIEIPAAIRKAKKEDLFIGELDNMHGQQSIKDNTTVFYKNCQGEIVGPFFIDSNSFFVEIYAKMLSGLIGVLTSVPSNLNVKVIDLVLRLATSEDFFDRPGLVKQNRIYYTYSDKKATGPFYTDSSTTPEMISNLLINERAFVPNERQHFKKKVIRHSA